MADAGVNLIDGQSRGIHMSRLYLALERLEHQPLTPSTIHGLLEAFITSHEGLSTAAHLRLDFDHPLKRPALVSPLTGWKRYQVSIEARLENEMFHVELFVPADFIERCRRWIGRPASPFAWSMQRACMPTTQSPAASGNGRYQLRGLTVPQSLPSQTARVFMLPCCCTPDALKVPFTWVVNSLSLKNVA